MYISISRVKDSNQKSKVFLFFLTYSDSIVSSHNVKGRPLLFVMINISMPNIILLQVASCGVQDVSISAGSYIQKVICCDHSSMHLWTAISYNVLFSLQRKDLT